MYIQTKINLIVTSFGLVAISKNYNIFISLLFYFVKSL